MEENACPLSSPSLLSPAETSISVFSHLHPLRQRLFRIILANRVDE